MASPLTVEQNPFGIGEQFFIIKGLTEEELHDLKTLSNHDALSKLLDILDERNDDLGTIWWRSSIVCCCWFDNEFAYIKLHDP